MRQWGLRIVVAMNILRFSTAVCGESIDPKSADAGARYHFALGRQLTRAHQYADARKQFELGYALSHRPLFLFNIAECARLMGDVDGSREAYMRYLREDGTGALAAETMQRLIVLRQQTHSNVKRAEPVPLANKDVDPPVDLRRSNVQILTAGSGPLALAAESSAPKPPAWKRWPFWVTIGSAVVAAAVVGTIAGVLATQTNNGCGNDCTRVDLRQ